MMWKAQVLDVEAQETDRKLFAVLHETTARVAQHFFVAKIEGFAARDLSDAYVAEAQALGQFLSSEARDDTVSHGELGPAMVQLKSELEAFLRQPLSQAEAQASDLALAGDLALEFAGALWATIISTLRTQTDAGGTVSLSNLLPRGVPGESTTLLDKVLEHCRHFELQASEINEIMVEVLRELTGSTLASNGYLYLPARLKIDLDELLDYLGTAHSQQPKGLLIADMIGVQWHKFRDLLR